MAWTTPRTWVAAEVVTAAIGNTHWRDNLVELRAGGVAIASQAANDLIYAASATQLARLATSTGFLRAAGAAPSWTVDGSTLTTLNAANLASGQVPYARRVPRVTTIASDANPFPDGGTTDLYIITALAVGANISITGTLVEGQQMTIRITDNGTARALAWGTAIVTGGTTLPVVTKPNKTLHIELRLDLTAGVWWCLGVQEEP